MIAGRWRISLGILCVALFSQISIWPLYAQSGPDIRKMTDVNDRKGPPAPAEGGSNQASTPRAEDVQLSLTLADAIIMAMENNRSLQVERLKPTVRETFEQQEEAVFDPVAQGRVSGSRKRVQQIRSGGTIDESSSGVLSLNMEAGKYFPTGTRVTLKGDIDRNESSQYSDYFTVSRLGLTVTQALLRNAGIGVNLIRLQQARLDTTVSRYELRGFSETLLNQIESAYWDYVLSERQSAIVQESLQLAEQHEKETREMITVGRLAESELVAAQAQTAARRQDLIDTRSNREVQRLRLLRLLNPSGSNPFKRQIVTLSRPEVMQVGLDDVDSHVAVAMRMRPDLNEARLKIKQGDLEIVKTKNGLLPKLDFFVTLGKTGYADTFGGSISDIPKDHYDILVGLDLSYPLQNRDASARHRRALLSREQTGKALDNLAQLVELDVRSAFIEVDRARQQITASAQTKLLEEEQLRIETEKFRVGRSTNFLVARAQRDLLVSQLSESRATSNYLKALTNLFRLEGSLLERRGVLVPDSQPLDEAEKTK